MRRLVCLGLFLLSLLFCPAHPGESNRASKRNFVDVRSGENKERQLRISYEGIIFSEYSVFSGDDETTLRQITNGKKLVQFVWKHDEMINCDYSQDLEQISAFEDQFVNESLEMGNKYGNVTELYLNTAFDTNTSALLTFAGKNMPAEFLTHVNIKLAKSNCHNLYRRMRKERRQKKKLAKLKKRAQKQNTTLVSSESKDNSSLEFTGNVRTKRSVFGSMLIFPGTKWCGKGDVAENYEDLGTDSDTDTCCRMHDHCPYLIYSLSWNYGIFNYRVSTLTHCECDIRFYNCLKQSSSKTANLIGRIYFNVIGTKCFVLKREKGCTRRTWWGTCAEEGVYLKAHVLNQRGFI